jgi:hypothetical protein
MALKRAANWALAVILQSLLQSREVTVGFRAVMPERRFHLLVLRRPDQCVELAPDLLFQRVRLDEVLVELGLQSADGHGASSAVVARAVTGTNRSAAMAGKRRRAPAATSS